MTASGRIAAVRRDPGLCTQLDRSAHRHSSPRWSPEHARELATHVLRGLPDRLAHSVQAGVQAEKVRGAVPADDADLLVTAALLHDIGYAPALHRTGFHPVDGATFLVLLGAPYRLAALVAHHSEARLLARAAGSPPPCRGSAASPARSPMPWPTPT